MVYANAGDRWLGIGLQASNPKAQDENNWRGKNWLGNVLTNVRDKLLDREEVNVDSVLEVESDNNIDDTDTEEKEEREKCSENCNFVCWFSNHLQ